MTYISDGSTASYYVLPEGARELQDLISERDMNAQIGEIFRACYRYGLCRHSDQLRDAKKILFYAAAEVKRLEALQGSGSRVRPTWVSAPDWARWLAQDPDGRWWWYEEPPQPGELGWEENNTANGNAELAGLTEVVGDWRDSLENRPAVKPDWKGAPEWAQWLTQNADGCWLWWEEMPIAGKSQWVDGLYTGTISFGGVSPVIGDWRETLEQRP